MAEVEMLTQMYQVTCRRKLGSVIALPTWGAPSNTVGATLALSAGIRDATVRLAIGGNAGWSHLNDPPIQVPSAALSTFALKPTDQVASIVHVEGGTVAASVIYQRFTADYSDPNLNTARVRAINHVMAAPTEEIYPTVMVLPLPPLNPVLYLVCDYGPVRAAAWFDGAPAFPQQLTVQTGRQTLDVPTGSSVLELVLDPQVQGVPSPLVPPVAIMVEYDTAVGAAYFDPNAGYIPQGPVSGGT